MKFKIKTGESRNELFDELGKKRLKESYMADGEVSPQERFAFVASSFGSNQEHAQRLYGYASQHWLSFSTPILSFGRNKRGLPISCFLNKIPDTAEGLVKNLSETNWLSMLGGGVGVHVQIRGADEKSVGVMPHLKTYDASSLAYRQGKTRRGSYAAFLDIDHPDIIQFLEMRKATGDQNQKALNLNHGVNIPDRFMQIIEKCMQDPTANDDWELIQPNSGKVVEVVSAKYLWMKLLELRMHTGEPYIWFIDRANEGLPWYQKEAGLVNYGSNICTEISLATSEERTAVCCLSSVNLEYYDDWKDNELFLPDILEMLDNVIEYFINSAPDEIERARYSAYRERAVGVGALGFHAFLQKNMIAFESAIAKSVNLEMFKHIKTSLGKANYELAVQRGACPDAKDYEVMERCSHITAIAPNASSSIIMGNTSPSVEPYAANAYRQDTASGAYINKNKFLDKIIREESKTKEDPEAWCDEVWASIIADEGSVLNQEWMDDYTKDVFKTAKEIDQLWIIEHAADRQPYVDQSQSINTFFPPSVNVKRLHAVHYLAWKKGLKGLYYLRSSKLRTADKVGKKVKRNKIEDEIDMQTVLDAGCIACE